MKNIYLLAAITFASAGLSSAACPQTNAQVYPVPLAIGHAHYPAASPTFSTYDQPFLDVHSLQALSGAKSAFDPAKISAFGGHLKASDGSSADLSQLKQMVLYVAAPSLSPASLGSATVYGVSVLRALGAQQDFHQLYQLDTQTNTYIEDASMSVFLDGALEIGSLSVAHFSVVPMVDGQIHPTSAIVTLDAPSTTSLWDSWAIGEFDTQLMGRLILNTNRQAGLRLIGTSSESLYDALLGTTWRNTWQIALSCRAHPFCDDAPANHRCIWDWDIFGNICISSRDDCVVVEIEDEIGNAPLAECWDLRDGFLANSTKGRQYISWYYYWCTVSPPATADLSVYASLLGQAVTPIQTILSGSGSTVVITSAYANQLIAQLDIEIANTTNVVMWRIFNFVKSDIQAMTGMTRAQVITYFGS